MGARVGSSPRPLLLLLLLLWRLGQPGAQAAWRRRSDRQNIFRQAASNVYQGACQVCGEDNVRIVQKFISKSTERFVNGVDVLVNALWIVWSDLLDVLGIDSSNLTHNFHPDAMANNPTGALLLVGVELMAYWLLSLFLGYLSHLLHLLFGRFFWAVRIILFTLSFVYILQKYEWEPD